MKGLDPKFRAAGRMPKDIEGAILDAIKRHQPTVEAGGNWNEVRAKFPNWIGDSPAMQRRLFRMIKSVRESVEVEVEAHVTPLEPIPTTGAMIRAAKATAEEGGGGPNIMAMLEQLLSDAEMQRQYTVKRGEDGGEAIKNPVLFDVSMKRRLTLIDTYLKVFQEVHDLRQVQLFFDEIVSIIVEEIAPLEPHVAQRIMDRLRQLRERRDEIRPA